MPGHWRNVDRRPGTPSQPWTDPSGHQAFQHHFRKWRSQVCRHRFGYRHRREGHLCWNRGIYRAGRTGQPHGRPLQFRKLPTELDQGTDLAALMNLNKLVLKACEPNPTNRFPSAEKMHAALSEIAATVHPVRNATFPSKLPTVISPIEVLPPAVFSGRPASQKSLHVIVLYKSNLQPDAHLLGLLNSKLTQRGCEVFFDRHLAIGVEWAREIENRIRRSDAAIVLLSATSVQSEMIAYEVEIADQAQQQSGKPRILPVRINYRGPLPSPLASILDPLQYFLWETP